MRTPLDTAGAPSKSWSSGARFLAKSGGGWHAASSAPTTTTLSAQRILLAERTLPPRRTGAPEPVSIRLPIILPCSQGAPAEPPRWCRSSAARLCGANGDQRLDPRSAQASTATPAGFVTHEIGQIPPARAARACARVAEPPPPDALSTTPRPFDPDPDDQGRDAPLRGGSRDGGVDWPADDQVRREAHDGYRFGDDGHDDGGSVAVFVEPEQRAVLADGEADDGAGREHDPADRRQAVQLGCTVRQRCEQGDAKGHTEDEVDEEQRPDVRDDAVVDAVVLLQVHGTRDDEGQRTHVTGDGRGCAVAGGCRTLRTHRYHHLHRSPPLPSARTDGACTTRRRTGPSPGRWCPWGRCRPGSSTRGGRRRRPASARRLA